MTTVLVAGFLVAHGLLHLAIWLPHPASAQEPPFRPDHSSVLTRTAAPAVAVHRLSVALAVIAAVGYVGTGVAAAVDAPGAGLAVLAAAVALVLKTLFFHPWLSLGILLDLGVLAAVLMEWPVQL